MLNKATLRFTATLQRLRSSLPRLVLVGSLFAAAAVLTAQQGPFGGGGSQRSGPAVRDIPAGGGFMFCRLRFTAVRQDPSGTGWAIEYPRADYNFMVRLAQFTSTPIRRYPNGEPAHALLDATDPDLFKCPFLKMASPGTVGFSDAEAEALRTYLLKGGFLWGDDFWTDPSWHHMEAQFKRILPEYSFQRLTTAHSLFSTFYTVTEIPQIPSLNRWRPGASTSEFGAETATPSMHALFDDAGRLMVLMSHNTDIADSWEREEDNWEYMRTFSPSGYAVGLNVAVYVMTR
jgi:hypothetical protein